MLSPNFALFLQRNAIDPAIYAETTERYRYFIINPALSALTLESLKDELPNVLISKSLFHESIYQLSASVNLSNCLAYKSSKILCLEASSIMAVMLLNICPSDHLLDLCCAPGGKLTLAGLIMAGRTTPSKASTTDQRMNKDNDDSGIVDLDVDYDNVIGSVTGVDISQSRLANAKALLKKYKVPFVTLFHQDASAFSSGPLLLANSITATKMQQQQQHQPDNIALKPNKDQLPENIFFVSSLLRKRPCLLVGAPSNFKYSKILLDAECTHDGSIKHVLKALNGSESERAVFDAVFSPENEKRIISQQKQLLYKAFSLLDTNGTLVYCTCSVSKLQNEDVIEEFIRNEPFAKLDEDLPEIPLTSRITIGERGVALRFCPQRSMTGGFFIARIFKV